MNKKILFFLLSFSFLTAQQVDNRDQWIRCASDELEAELQLINPEFIAERDLYIERGQQMLKDNPQWRTDANSQNTIYIPVIFHVLYNSSSDNISAALVGANFDQIDQGLA